MEEYNKEQLEIEKLKLEIQNEKKPFYKKISFYSYLSPVAVSIVAIVFSISSGFFENESKLLDLRKENLRNEISLFEKKKDSLLTSINELKNERDSIYKENKNLKSQNIKLELLSKKLTLNQSKLNNIIKDIKDSVEIKQKEFNDIHDQYEKLNNDKILLASKMKELRQAIYPQLQSDENTKVIFNDILKILDENLGGFSTAAKMLFFFSK